MLRDTLMEIHVGVPGKLPQDGLMTAFKDYFEEDLKRMLFEAITSETYSRFSYGLNKI